MTFVIFSFFHYTICAICDRIKLTGHENVPCGNYEKGGKHRMQKAIDKHVILMMGLLFLLNRSLTYGPVVTFLAALISMELIIYLEKEVAFYPAGPGSGANLLPDQCVPDSVPQSV